LNEFLLLKRYCAFDIVDDVLEASEETPEEEVASFLYIPTE
jgi:hypothetical protein